MSTRPRPSKSRMSAAPMGQNRVKRYRKVNAVACTYGGPDGDRPSPQKPSLWDRDLWEEDLFEHAEPELTSPAS